MEKLTWKQHTCFSIWCCLISYQSPDWQHTGEQEAQNNCQYRSKISCLTEKIWAFFSCSLQTWLYLKGELTDFPTESLRNKNNLTQFFVLIVLITVLVKMCFVYLFNIAEIQGLATSFVCRQYLLPKYLEHMKFQGKVVIGCRQLTSEVIIIQEGLFTKQLWKTQD